MNFSNLIPFIYFIHLVQSIHIPEIEFENNLFDSSNDKTKIVSLKKSNNNYNKLKNYSPKSSKSSNDKPKGDKSSKKQTPKPKDSPSDQKDEKKPTKTSDSKAEKSKSSNVAKSDKSSKKQTTKPKDSPSDKKDEKKSTKKSTKKSNSKTKNTKAKDSKSSNKKKLPKTKKLKVFKKKGKVLKKQINKGVSKTSKNINGQKSFRTSKQPGSYANKDVDRKNLGEKFGIKISGETHEAEHVIGVKVLLGVDNKDSDRKSIEGKRIEKASPAYHEQKKFHTKHVGTGKPGKNGKPLQTKNFGKEVTDLLDNGQFGKAIALNQKEYGKIEGFVESLTKVEGKAASDSFFGMIKANPTFERIKPDKTSEKINLSRSQQIEAIASRLDLIGKSKNPNFSIGNQKDYEKKINSFLDRDDKNEKFEDTFFG